MGPVQRCVCVPLWRADIGLDRYYGSSGGPSYTCIPKSYFRRGMTTTWEYRQAEPGHYPRMRAIFISDMHLGTAPLRPTGCSTSWGTTKAMSSIWRAISWTSGRCGGPHWPQTHNDALQKHLRQVRKGARLVFVPGNHDEGYAATSACVSAASKSTKTLCIRQRRGVAIALSTAMSST
jgi:hypothetical protein